MKEKLFEKGDTVTWTSQASGTPKTKTGTVIYVLSTGERIPESVLAEGRAQFDMASMRSTREHPSYVVKVERASKATGKPIKPFLYWPIVSQLEKVDATVKTDEVSYYPAA